MKKLEMITILCATLILSFWASNSSSETITQDLSLNPGWNAVFLEVDPPEPNDPATVFGSIPDLISVWRWNTNTSTVEFIQDPHAPMPDQSTWRAYYHSGGAVPDELKSFILSNLHAVQGNTAYLIQRGGSVQVNFEISGEPVVPAIIWKSNSFNLVGFPLPETGEPTFIDFFSSSPAHAENEIWVLQNNAWVLAGPADTMKKGEAFWIYCKGSATYTGPLDVRLEFFGGLEFGNRIDEQDVVVTNADDVASPITIAPTTAFGYLYYWYFDVQTGKARWEPVTMASPLSMDLMPGESQRIRLGVKRNTLAENEVADTNLEITDTKQQILVPVSVTGTGYSGLWVGYASLNKVSEVRKEETPIPTGTIFSFRLIVHVDANGNARLLQEIFQMWQEGTWKPDPENLGKEIVDQPGHFVLLTDDILAETYEGAAMLDGRVIGRRISSSAFGFSDPVPMNGGFGSNNTLTSVPITLEAVDPVNPFVHRYHPRHFTPEQNVQGEWSHKDEEMFTIERAVTLTFSDSDSDGTLILDSEKLNWGSSTVGGIYSEQVTGLHRNSIKSEGIFVLHKVSDEDTLNPAPGS